MHIKSLDHINMMLKVCTAQPTCVIPVNFIQKSESVGFNSGFTYSWKESTCKIIKEKHSLIQNSPWTLETEQHHRLNLQFLKCVCWLEPWGTRWFHDGNLRDCPPHTLLQSRPHRCSRSRCQWVLPLLPTAAASASYSGSSASSSSHPSHLFTHKNDKRFKKHTGFVFKCLPNAAVDPIKQFCSYLVSSCSSANFVLSSCLDMRLMCPLARAISLYTGWLKSLFDSEGDNSGTDSSAGQILLQGFAWGVIISAIMCHRNRTNWKLSKL